MAYSFRLPPITDLTIEQQMVLSETQPVSLSGGAGTGKTVVSLWKHIENTDTLNKNSLLVTYTKTLRVYLYNCTLAESVNASSKICSAFNIINCDEIIIDEAQDLELLTLENINSYAQNISYGADFNQRLYSQGITETEIKNLFTDNIEYTLHQNFRNTSEIINFTKSVLPDFLISDADIEGILPIISIVNDFEEQMDKIIAIVNDFQSDAHNIAILLPFGDGKNNQGNIWDRLYNQCVEKYYTHLINRGIQCSKYYNDESINNVEINNIHITTFKSAKGLEFDTVIIPNFHQFRNNISYFNVVNEKDYYVAFTRTVKNLYLLSSSELEFIDSNTYELEG